MAGMGASEDAIEDQNLASATSRLSSKSKRRLASPLSVWIKGGGGLGTAKFESVFLKFLVEKMF